VREVILDATREALSGVAEPRFFRTERGYHGRFYCKLQTALDSRDLLCDGAILEMEYQKSTRHQMTQRPDIIFHIPSEESGAHVSANNYAVFALKRQASQAQAVADFLKLDEICARLHYPLGIFINIASKQHHREMYTGQFPDRIHAFGVVLANGAARVFEA
jgi:hypothetical protein